MITARLASCVWFDFARFYGLCATWHFVEALIGNGLIIRDASKCACSASIVYLAVMLARALVNWRIHKEVKSLARTT